MRRSLFPTLGILCAMGTVTAASAVFSPHGEAAFRIGLARNRIIRGEVPSFTKDFILADVALRPDYPRRFTHYSGDLSGRVIGALAMMPDGLPEDWLRGLVDSVRSYQKEDGRFGNRDLRYTKDSITRDHMALLWGNGRLLVGLMEYYDRNPDPGVLETARKSADFLRSVYDACADEEVAERVKDMGAAGMICFSQLIEGLVMLARAAGDPSYLDDAERIVPWFPRARGTQHTHGYLTSLRGLVMLSEASGKQEYFNLARKLYDDLVDSTDFTIYGGVREYFGQCPRDEGCSEADFLRLSLDLWRITQDAEYLERAQFCLLNQFYANQFPTGDFGHRLYFENGLIPSRGAARAWWCCTMHGLRAFRDILDNVISEEDGLVRIGLFIDGTWKSRNTSLVLNRDPSTGGISVRILKSPAEGVRLAVSNPSWVEETAVNVNGRTREVRLENGFAVLDATLTEGDIATVRFRFKARLITEDGKERTPEELESSPVRAAFLYGPWVLGVDETDNPLFFGEPWSRNEILLPEEIRGTEDSAGHPLERPAAHIRCEYRHDGFPGTFPVTLRPVSERSRHRPSVFGVWLNYRQSVR